MGKIHHSSLKACSHSCARHNFFPTCCLAVVVENKFHHSWLRHSWCNLFFSPRLLSHSWGKICDLHMNGNMPFVTHGVFSIHSLGASPLVSVFSNPYFSSVGDWLNTTLSTIGKFYFTIVDKVVLEQSPEKLNQGL